MQLLNTSYCEIIERSDQTMFVTALYMVIDTEQRRLNITTAGHPLPILASRDSTPTAQMERLGREGPALGLFAGANFAIHQQPITPGDLVFLYTDGIPEAESSQGEMFGTENVIKSIHGSLDKPLREICSSLISELHDFSQNNKPDDDICLVAVEVLSAAEVESV